MRVIYRPKGRALEYAPLACNLYMGCAHGCVYCYAPGCVRRTLESWRETIEARKDIISSFTKDVAWLSKNRSDDERRRVLFCFLSDPYQPLEGELHITHECIKIAMQYGVKIDVLTKGAYSLVSKDFDLMKRADVHLGVTLAFVDDRKRQQWEPYASSVQDRFRVLKEAHRKGIFTWVSMEPVIDPKEALAVIDEAAPYVDFWKIGKLNYNKAVEDLVDWHKFYWDIRRSLKHHNARAYIKKSLKSFARKAT